MSEWTKTPPSETGWYWWKPQPHMYGFICHIQDIGPAWQSMRAASRYWMNCLSFPENMDPETAEGVWWPVPIQHPDDEPTNTNTPDQEP